MARRHIQPPRQCPAPPFLNRLNNVSRALQAVVLKTIEVARHFIGRTHTAFGLHVLAEVARRTYQKGLKATPAFLTNNPIQPDNFLPQLNYTAPWTALL